jgi:hypothetical protein
MTTDQLTPDQPASLLRDIPRTGVWHRLPVTNTGQEVHDWGDDPDLTLCGRAVSGTVEVPKPTCRRCREAGGWRLG